MLAASWLDLVIGVDIHIHLVPSPAGPVPTPIPQPYVGLIGDPVGMMVSIAQSMAMDLMTGGPYELPKGPVLINGLPAATTGERSKNTPLLLHIPMPPGTAHVKPPSGEATFPLGALKVSFGGDNSVRIGEMALSCADPVPMPTSKVVVIPKGPPVMVMGAPGFNVQAAVAKWVMGKAIRTAWKRVSPLARRLGKLAGPRLRNLFSKVKCFITGHPIDVATGRVFTSATDFALPGPLPLVFERTYFSSWSHRDGSLGFGWSHSLDQALWFEPGSAVYRNAEGQEIVFVLETGESPELEREFFDGISRNTLVRERNGWRVITAEGLVHHFTRIEGGGAILGVVRTTTRNPDVATIYGYDRDGRLREVTDSAGRVVRFEHNGHGRMARILLPDPAGPGWVPHAEFVYSDDGLLLEARNAYGHATRYGYDGRLMVEESDRNGVTFYWIYDGRGSTAHCVRTWGVAGSDIIYNQKIDYDLRNRNTLVTDSYNNKTLYKMSPAGAVVEVIDALGGTTAREYDDDLQLVLETDAAGNRTKHVYGPRGQLAMTIFPDGSQTVNKYDPHFPELVKLHQTEAGAVWRFQYDTRGQLLEARGPEPDSFQRYEWEAGRVKATIEASGARTEVVERDRWGNPVLLRLSAGALVQREYDCRGRVVALVNPYGGRERREYDRLDRLAAIHEGDGNPRRLSYDAEGNLLEVTDRLSTSRFTYTNWNKLASREDGAGPGRAGDTIRFVWGQEGELREIRNERNHDHRFFYDPCLRLEREVGFDLQETRYMRDAAGQVTRVEKPAAGVHTDLTMDSRGRVTAVVHSDGSWSRFAYRKDGELMEAANEVANVRFKKDGLGRVLSEAVDDVEIRSFHTAGQRTRIESTLGAAFDLGRDPTGNLTSLSVGFPEQGWAKTLSIEYDEVGLEARRVLPGGVTADWHHDQQGRPTRQTVSGPAATWSRDYHWAFDDRITRIDDTRFGTTTYDHDPRGRLIAEHHNGQTLHRALDEVGNVFRTPDRSDRRYVRGGIIRNDGDVTFTFDRMGRMVERNLPDGTSWRYRWDGAGMLREVVRPDGLAVKYAYDALGRRISKKVGDVETRWVWDGDLMLHETTGQATVTWCYEPETFTPLARLESGGVRHVVADHLGTPIALYEPGGDTSWQSRPDLLGRSTPPISSTLCPLRWPGQVEDADCGLSYNRFRYYDSSLGAFISPDPVWPFGGLSTYAYVADPIVLTDPFGLAPWSFNPKVDLDWTREGKSFDDALQEAFRRTGVSRDRFKATKWGKTILGKSMVTEWSVPGGAMVSVDDPSIVPTREGPQLPHVGYQTPGRRRRGGRVRGHILLPGVPVTRGSLQSEKANGHGCE
jgi:RHS repeat-associated protein